MYHTFIKRRSLVPDGNITFFFLVINLQKNDGSKLTN